MQHFENNLKGNKNKLSSIFLADDDPDDHLLFSMALNKADPSVILTSFYNCTELFTYIEKPGDLPDVIFLDLNMPGLGGLETCRALRERSDIPIIIPPLKLTIAGRQYVTDPISLVAYPEDASRRSVPETESTRSRFKAPWPLSISRK